MNKKERALRQAEISRKALVRALVSVEEGIMLLRFKPKRNAFQKKQELASQIMSTWSFQEAKESEPEDDYDFADEIASSTKFERAAHSLDQTLFERMQGSVQICTSEGHFLYNVSGVSYETFRETVQKHSNVICSMKPEHDKPAVKGKKSSKRIPFHIIVSTNGENIATLRALREKVLKKP